MILLLQLYKFEVIFNCWYCNQPNNSNLSIENNMQYITHPNAALLVLSEDNRFPTKQGNTYREYVT